MSPRRKAALLSALLAAVSVPVLFSAGKKTASFVDPTVEKLGPVKIGDQVYVAPFAVLDGSKHPLLIRDRANIQDSVRVDATNGAIVIGSEAILAHGATVKGSTKIHTEIGAAGKCHGDPPPEVCPSFVGFNAEVDGAIIQKDAMVGHLARVADGVTNPFGQEGQAWDERHEAGTSSGQD